MDTLKTFQVVRDHTRRATLAGLGGIALGGVVAPALAGKKTRKAVRRAKKKGKKKCRNQDGQCAAAMTTLRADGGVSVLRVEQVPVARRQLGHE